MLGLGEGRRLAERVDVRQAWHFLHRPLGARQWDRLLWATGALGFLCILIVLTVPRAVSDWVAFFAVVAIGCGPTSVVMPVTTEPFIMTFGRVHDPMVVALVGTGAMFLIEFVNYQLFADVLHARVLRRFRHSRAVQRVTQGFQYQPFFVVLFVAFGPFPFEAVRALSALSGYSYARYLCAMTIGRFPRLWLIALTGSALPLSPEQLLTIGLSIAAVLCFLILNARLRERKRRILRSAAG